MQANGFWQRVSLLKEIDVKYLIKEKLHLLSLINVRIYKVRKTAIYRNRLKRNIATFNPLTAEILKKIGRCRCLACTHRHFPASRILTVFRLILLIVGGGFSF